MKICPVCGETVEDATLLCPECGARVEPSTPAETVQPREADAVREDVAEAAPPVKKGFSGKTAGLIAAGVGCVAVIVLAALLLSGAFATPAQKFVAYQRQALMEGVVEPFAKGIDQANGRVLSTDMTLTAAIEGDDQVSALLDGSAISLKVDQRENGLLTSAGLTLRGEDVLEGTLSFEDGKIGCYVPQLDDTYYTLDLARMAEKWGVDELSVLTELKRTVIPTDQLKKLCEKYIDLVLRVVNENNVAVFKGEEVSMEILEGTAAGTLYVCQPSAEEWETLLLQLAYTLESDQELRDFLTACMEGRQAILDGTGKSVEDMADESLTDAAKSLREEAERLAQEAEDAGLRWLLCLDGSRFVKWAVELGDGQVMVGLEAKEADVAAYVISGEEKYVLSARLGKDGGARQGMISAWYDDGASQGMARLEYDHVEEGKSALDIPRGRYVLQITEEEPVELELEVTESEDGGTDHLLTLPAALTTGTELRVNLHTTDKKATCQLPQKEPVDISDYNEEDFQELADRWGEAARDWVYEMQDLLAD